MSYSAGEALVLTRLRAIAGSIWTTENTSQAKYKILNGGKADHYAVLHQGAGKGNEMLSGNTSLRIYETVIEIWSSYRDDGTSYTNLVGYMEAILDMYDQYRKLGDTTGLIQDSICSHWDEPEEMWNKGGEGPRWLRQKFYIQWSEENPITFAE